MDKETADLVRGILTDFAVVAIEAWKRNDEGEMDAAIATAIEKIEAL